MPHPSIKSVCFPSGRQAYNPREDAAILKYVHLRKSEVKGNRLWQQMEKESVTTHSWQSMKARYKDHLVHKHTEDVGVEEAAGDVAQVISTHCPLYSYQQRAAKHYTQTWPWNACR